MPNTLCHIALQGPLTRTLVPKIPFQWVAAGCIIPDIPWITFRLLKEITIFSVYDLKLYCAVQASLFFCVILAAALALTVRQGGMVFSVLAANAFAHLLFDATQIKLGNGVNLIAPFDWKLFNLGLLWPEHPVYLVLTCIGGLYFVWRWRKEFRQCPACFTPVAARMIIAGILLACYFAGPLLFVNQAEKEDVHFLHTLKDKEHRTGKLLLIDRDDFDADTQQISICVNERFTVEGKVPQKSGTYSIEGYFTAPTVIKAVRVYHHGTFRDWASVVGLLMTALFWLTGLYHCRFRQKNKE